MTPAEVPRLADGPVHALVRAQAARTPDAPAIEHGDVAIGYRALSDDAARLAGLLVAGGADADVPVAVLSDDPVLAVTAMLAVLEAGAAFVLLDPQLPAARVGAMLRIAAPPLVLVDDRAASLAERLREDLAGARTIPLARAAWRDRTPFAAPAARDPDGLAYVTFTSGSSGEPKPIAGRLKGIDHFVRWEIGAFGIGPGSRVSRLTTPAFDAFLRDAFAPLCAGGTMVSPADRAATLTAQALGPWIAAERLTHVHCVPTVFRLLLEAPAETAFSALRWIALAGEALRPADVARWYDRFGASTRLANLYGPSETTMTKFVHLVEPADAERATVPIGRPMPGARALVVDPRDRACSPGTVGEILIRTPYRSLGYFRRPELTAAAFVPNPFGDDPSDLVYRTGDFGRVLDDGTFELIGRRDGQVKIAGVRVELAEIDGLLREHPDVADVAVVARDDRADGATYLCAYVVGRVEVSGAVLRAYLAARLPDAMIPAAFVPLAALPRTITGKLDRRALPRPDEVLRANRPHVAPATPVEEILAGMWAGVLGIARAGALDDFFELGGHSLLALQLLARIEATFGVALPLRELFDARSLRELARRVEAGLDGAPAPPAEIARADRAAALPLSSAQKRLWFLERLNPGTPVYHLPTVVAIDGALDEGALAAALDEVVARHDSLLSAFPEEGGVPVLRIVPDACVRLRTCATGPALAGGDEAAIRRLVTEEIRRPFDLGAAPLMRALLIRSGSSGCVLALTMHHLVADARSVAVVLHDLADAYARRAGGGGQPPERPALHHVDFVAAAASAPAGTAGVRRAYWLDRLAGLRTLELPADRARPPLPTFQGAHELLDLGAELTAAVHAFACERSATPFMVLLAGFYALLRRFTDEDDLVVGTPVANRPHIAMERLVGFFANTVVLRTDASGDPPFAELLARTRETALAAYAHQDVALEEIVRELQPERDLSRQPLFAIGFVLQHETEPEVGVERLALRPVDIDAGIARFDLTVELREDQGALRARFEYALDLFEPVTIRRFGAAYRTLLAGAIAAPETALSRLPLIGDAEVRSLAAAGTAAGAVAPPGGAGDDAPTLDALFGAAAAAYGHAVALVCGAERLTYAELDARANRLAHHLRASGVEPGRLVGLYFEPCTETIVSILAVLKAGAGYLPLDRAYPPNRIAMMLVETQAAAVITMAELAARLPAVEIPVVRADADAVAIAARPATCPPAAHTADATAYVIYTSGSTGCPKGVVTSHRNVVPLLRAMEPVAAPSAQDAWLLFHSYAFDFSVWEIWGALLYGGRLVVVPYMTARSPAALVDLLVAERITVLNQTPSAFWVLERALEAQGGMMPPSLRAIFVGGEAFDYRRLRGWFARYGDVHPRLIAVYGITETTVFVTARPLGRDDAAEPAPSVIGDAIAGYDLYLLDAHGVPVPPGVAGELCIGGPGLAMGYLGRPALTAERFVPDPYSGRTGARLYRSGDLARRRWNGELEILGRSDQQVKIRGYRIETGEIEAVLAAHAAVAEAAVVVRDDDGGPARLVAYLTPRGGVVVPVADVRRSVEMRLPKYMVPAAFVVLDELPLNKNGKLDRAALPVPAGERPALADAYVAPRTQPESALARIWSEVLHVERVGVRDNFFVLGGDSIRSIEVCTRARATGVSVTVQQLFRLQTIEALAGASSSPDVPCVAAGGVARPFGLVRDADLARLPAGLDDAFPLASLQLGMLYHSDLDPEARLYHAIESCRLRVDFDEPAFRAALATVMRRHPMLRVSFDLARYGEPLQLVHRLVRTPLRVEDMRSLPPGERDAVVTARVDAERRRARPWSEAPLFDAIVHRLGDGEVQFTLSFHHAILDGWSVATLMNELFAEYAALRGGEPSRLGPPPRATYRAFVKAQREASADPADRGFWRAYLDGAERTALPRWPQRGARGTAVRELALDGEVSQALKDLGRACGVTLKSVLFAAHLRVLALLSGRDDVVSGLIGHARPEVADGERVLGLFLNTVPVRLRMRRESWRETIRRAFEAETEVQPHLRYPLDRIQVAGGGALFESVFNYAAYADRISRDLRTGGIELVDGRVVDVTNFPLVANFALDPLSGAVALGLVADGTLVSPELLALIAALYRAALEAAAGEQDEVSVDAASLPPPGTVLDRVAEVPEAADVCAAVASAAAECGDRPAVVDDRGMMSYAELAAAAERLAGALRGAGLGAEERVAICLPRDARLVVAMLGVLTAGASYVPLDPEYPPERLALILADSRPAVVLTDSALLDRLPPAAEGEERWCLDGALPAAPPAPLATAHDERNAAYTIFTSGSTGTPKGVVVPRGALARFLGAIRTELGVGPEDRLLAVTGLPFDIAALELLLPLTARASVVVASAGDVRDPAGLAARLADAAITTMQATPSLWRMLADTGWRPRAGLRVLCGGEPLERRLAEALLENGAALWNLYGPTETTIWSTAQRVVSGTGPVTLGTPLAGTRVVVLDRDGNPALPGAAGELAIGGTGVARGYLGRPRLTAERFVPDPFSAVPGGRLYRTGDLVRDVPGVGLEFLGRVDDQVKVRGHRVEPAEIEAVLARHPALGTCAVVGRRSGAETSLYAFFSSPYATAPTDGELRTFIARRLPPALVPDVFVRLDVMPRTANGKVDRRALAALPDVAGTERAAAALVAPRDDVELALTAIWRDVLGTGEIGVRDHLFLDLGGHSLRAVQLAAAMRERLAPEFSLADLVAAGTIEACAAEIRRGGARHRPSTLALQARGSQRPLFCVHSAVGTSIGYLRLALALGADQPCHGLDARGLDDGDEPPRDTVEAMAEAYLAVVRQVQPHGPYRFAGHSFGGLVAYEMALRLTEAHESVELVALLDSMLPDIAVPPPPHQDDAEWMIATARTLERFFALPLDVNGIDPHAPPHVRAAAVARCVADAGLLPADVAEPLLQGMVRVQRANAAAAARYRPRRYSGPVLVVRPDTVAADDAARMPERALRDPSLGWNDLVDGEVDVQFVPGDHVTMIAAPAAVAAVAALLRAALDGTARVAVERV